MTKEHPITPPPELLQYWATEYWGNPGESIGEGERYIAIQAARWGADHELEACCKAFEDIWDQEKAVTLDDFLRGIRTARRPKLPSLKEQALLQLDTLNADLAMHGLGCDLSQIRRALEALPDG